MFDLGGLIQTANQRRHRIKLRLRKLKDEVDGGLYTSGSAWLVRTMLADGLVDELHLCVYPLTRGAGPRLFLEEAEPRKLSLAASESYDNGVLYLVYEAR